MDPYSLLTGRSGFLGNIIYEAFNDPNLLSLGRSKSDHFNYNLLDRNILFDKKFDIVIHCAGKAHTMPKDNQEKQMFFDVNVKGTENLLRGLEQSAQIPRSFVYISSVAVYGLENGLDINEEYALNAKDAYGKSKIDAEQIVQTWCAKYNVICTILRLPLLAGPNPPGNLNNMIKGIQKGYYFNIANGRARKSIVLARDVGEIIKHAAEIGGLYNLTDGYHPSFRELSDCISLQLNRVQPFNMPYPIANALAKIGNLFGTRSPINSNKLAKITSDLTFNDSKARKFLGWKPNPVLKGFKIK